MLIKLVARKAETAGLVLLMLSYHQGALSGDLHDAAEKADYAEVKRLLSPPKGAISTIRRFFEDTDVNETYYGDMPLHYAAYSGDVRIIELLFSKGADINAVGRYKRTPLYWAAREGHLNAVKYLLEHGAAFNESTQIATLEGSVCENRVRVVEFLTNYGANLKQHADVSEDRLDNDPYASGSLLHVAAYCGNQDLGTQHGASGPQFETLVSGYKKYGDDNVEIARFLISQGANVNQINQKGKTALHYAAGAKNIALVTYLVEAGANIDLTDNKGWSPLHYADNVGDTETQRLLMNRGAQFDVNGLIYPKAFNGGLRELVWDWRAERFLVTDADVLFEPFPKNLTVSTGQKVITNIVGGHTLVRLIGKTQSTKMSIPSTDSKVLWIDNSSGHPVTVSLQDGQDSNSRIEIPSGSIYPHLAGSDVILLEVKANNKIIETARLMICCGRSYVYNVGTANRYRIDTRSYK